MKLRLNYVHAAHEMFDSKVAGLKKRPDWKPITCRQGCHACCSEPLHVNMAEAKVIVNAIPPGELEGVKARTKEWADQAEASGLLKEELPLAWDWLKFKLVCPLLKNGLCLVYQNRPMGCRSHNAVGDPALCHSIEGRKIQKYFYSPELDQMTAFTLTGASNLADHLGAFLSQMLLKRHVPTAARGKLPIKYDGLSGPKHAGVLHFRRTDK